MKVVQDCWQSLYLMCKENIYSNGKMAGVNEHGKIKHNVEIDPRDVIQLIDQVRSLNKQLSKSASTCTKQKVS